MTGGWRAPLVGTGLVVTLTSACVASAPGRPVLTHPRLALLHAVAEQVTRAALAEGLPADVRVLVYDTLRLNAVGRPQGLIYVARGLLERAGPEVLTHVLAHEVAHHALGHIGGDGTGARRDEEIAADCAALRIVRRLGYDAAGYAATLEWFRLSLGPAARDDIPTHPPLEERAQRVATGCER